MRLESQEKSEFCAWVSSSRRRPVKNPTLEARSGKLSATFGRMPDERMVEQVYWLPDTLMKGFALMNFSASEPVAISANDEAKEAAL